MKMIKTKDADSLDIRLVSGEAPIEGLLAELYATKPNGEKVYKLIVNMGTRNFTCETGPSALRIFLEDGKEGAALEVRDRNHKKTLNGVMSLLSKKEKDQIVVVAEAYGTNRVRSKPPHLMEVI